MNGFGSDNHAGAHPEVLAALAEASAGHAAAYGADRWTARAEELLREQFGEQAVSFLVFNGSAANVLCLRALCRPWESVICTAQAHINVDEGGAPERIAGVKLQPVATHDAKLTPEHVEWQLGRVGDEHAVQPRVVSITQSTELGTRYSPYEIHALAHFAHSRGLLLHVDGARLANAAAALERAAARDHDRRRRRRGLLRRDEERARARRGGRVLRSGPRRRGSPTCASRRCSSRRRAAFSPRSSSRCSRATSGSAAPRMPTRWPRASATRCWACPGVRLTQPVQANGVFALLPPGTTEQLQRDWGFYTWDAATGEVRLMCAWDTTAEEVDAFVADVARACQTAPAGSLTDSTRGPS